MSGFHFIRSTFYLPGGICRFWRENVCGSYRRWAGAGEGRTWNTLTLKWTNWWWKTQKGGAGVVVPLTSPISSFSSVDFPAPLGPTRATRVSKSIPNSRFLYMWGCGEKEDLSERLRNVTVIQRTSRGKYTHCVVTVLEADVLNHDNRRRNLPTGRKKKWQSLKEKREKKKKMLKINQTKSSKRHFQINNPTI